MNNTNDRRGILKQLILGQINSQEAAVRLQGQDGYNPILIVIDTEDGLYSIGSEVGLTQEQMIARTRGKVHIIIDKDSAQVGNSFPE